MHDGLSYIQRVKLRIKSDKLPSTHSSQNVPGLQTLSTVTVYIQPIYPFPLVNYTLSTDIRMAYSNVPM